MAQPSVAREPSMEDILASIRRIIESNEPEADEPAAQAVEEPATVDDADDDAARDGDLEDIQLTVDDQMQNVASAPVPHPEKVEAVAAPVSPQPISQERRREPESRSMSMADVAARVRAASDRAPGEAPRTAEGQPARAAGQARSVELRSPAAVAAQEDAAARTVPAAARPAGPTETAPRQSLASRDEIHAASQTGIAAAPRSAEAELASIAANDRALQPELAAVRATEVSRSLDAGQPLEPSDSTDEARTLMSPRTGLQVSRSFDELAEIVQTTARRSLDEVTEDLLRPMLQEWLDDNLPTLVERLVREEIERVARGPRR